MGGTPNLGQNHIVGVEDTPPRQHSLQHTPHHVAAPRTHSRRETRTLRHASLHCRRPLTKHVSVGHAFRVQTGRPCGASSTRRRSGTLVWAIGPSTKQGNSSSEVEARSTKTAAESSRPSTARPFPFEPPLLPEEQPSATEATRETATSPRPLSSSPAMAARRRWQRSQTQPEVGPFRRP